LNSVEEIVLNLDEAQVEVGRTVIWKAKDGDYPVTIAGDPGVGPDGRQYVVVECTSTGIPLERDLRFSLSATSPLLC
jgi:hypothetical protein